MADQDRSERILSAEMAGRIGVSLSVGEMDPAQKRRLRERLLGSVKGGDQPLFIVRADEGEWVDSVPGIRIKQLYREPAGPYTTSLWRVQPGTTVEPHAHDHDEECLVLEGELLIGGVTLRAGDYILGRKGIDHPEASSPCGALLLIRSAEYALPAPGSRLHA